MCSCVIGLVICVILLVGIHRILSNWSNSLDNVSDWIFGEWYNEGQHPDTEAEAQELVDEINAIVDKHFERIER